MPAIGALARAAPLIIDGGATDRRRLFNVKDSYDGLSGAKGDGSTNDYAAVVRAMNAAMNVGGGIVYFPSGTYVLGSTLNPPTGVMLAGDGMSSSWLKGKLTFGSNQFYSDLRIGNYGTATHNIHGANNTTFLRCKFRGGAGSPPVDCSNLKLAGEVGSASYITFDHCDIERNLGTEVYGGQGIGYNNVSVTENGTTSSGPGHFSHITFTYCNIGVHNGNATNPIGGPRAGMEVYTWEGGDQVAERGYEYVSIDHCVFEVTDSFNLDLADWPLSNGQRSAGPVYVGYCTLKGASGANGAPFVYTFCHESPKGLVFEYNTLYNGRSDTLHSGSSSGHADDPIYRYNTIDHTYNNGVPMSYGQYSPLNNVRGGSSALFTENHFYVNNQGPVLELWEFDGDCTNNHIIEYSANPTYSSIGIAYDWCEGATITGNTLETWDNADMQIFQGQGNSGVTVSGNTFIHHG